MPVEISGIIFHVSPLFIDRNEASPRFEICGKCKENIAGVCAAINEPIRSFIYYAGSGCPISKWGLFDNSEKIKLAESAGFNIKCCP